jgi:hypothetical protein
MSVRLPVIFMVRLSRMCVCEATIDRELLMAKRSGMAALQIGDPPSHRVSFDGYAIVL